MLSVKANNSVEQGLANTDRHTRRNIHSSKSVKTGKLFLGYLLSSTSLQAQFLYDSVHSLPALSMSGGGGQTQGSREHEVLPHCQTARHNVILEKKSEEYKTIVREGGQTWQRDLTMQIIEKKNKKNKIN